MTDDKKEFMAQGIWLRDHPLKPRSPEFVQKSDALAAWAKARGYLWTRFPEIEDGRTRADSDSQASAGERNDGGFAYYYEVDILFYFASVIDHLETGATYCDTDSTFRRMEFVLAYYRNLVHMHLSRKEPYFEFYCDLENKGQLEAYVRQAIKNRRMQYVKDFFHKLFHPRKTFSLFD